MKLIIICRGRAGVIERHALHRYNYHPRFVGGRRVTVPSHESDVTACAFDIRGARLSVSLSFSLPIPLHPREWKRFPRAVNPESPFVVPRKSRVRTLSEQRRGDFSRFERPRACVSKREAVAR